MTKRPDTVSLPDERGHFGPWGGTFVAETLVGPLNELQHAWENTKEVYVVWKPACEPSPFITETATAVFVSVQEALQHFQKKNYIGDFQLDLPQANRAPRERGRFG